MAALKGDRRGWHFLDAKMTASSGERDDDLVAGVAHDTGGDDCTNESFS